MWPWGRASSPPLSAPSIHLRVTSEASARIFSPVMLSDLPPRFIYVLTLSHPWKRTEGGGKESLSGSSWEKVASPWKEMGAEKRQTERGKVHPVDGGPTRLRSLFLIFGEGGLCVY